MPAIRTLRANMESQKHTTRGSALAQTREVFGLLIKIHYSLWRPLFQGAEHSGGHVSTAHIHMTNTPVISMSEERNFIKQTRTSRLSLTLCSPLDRFILCLRLAGLHLEGAGDETDGKCQNLLLIKDAYCCVVLGIWRDRRRGR